MYKRQDTNFTDEVLSTEWNESELENDDLKNYKAKAEYYIRQHQDNIAIAKLKRNKPLTSTDIAMLEEVLWSEVGTKQDYEQEFGEKPLGEFVREIVGLDMNAAKEAFSEYLTNARDVYKRQGIFKTSDNIIREMDAEGNEKIRFRPVAAWETPASIDELCKACLLYTSRCV